MKRSTCFCALAVIAASANVAAATCYTVPEEYRSGLWEAIVDGQANGVASARTCDPSCRIGAFPENVVVR